MSHITSKSPLKDRDAHLKGPQHDFPWASYSEPRCRRCNKLLSKTEGVACMTDQEIAASRRLVGIVRGIRVR